MFPLSFCLFFHEGTVVITYFIVSLDVPNVGNVENVSMSGILNGLICSIHFIQSLYYCNFKKYNKNYLL